jgi:hypothetical protein
MSALPKPTFKINTNNFEGSIGNLENFRELDEVARADLLQDWITELIQEYNLTLNSLYPKAKSNLQLVNNDE